MQLPLAAKLVLNLMLAAYMLHVDNMSKGKLYMRDPRSEEFSTVIAILSHSQQWHALVLQVWLECTARDGTMWTAEQP